MKKVLFAFGIVSLIGLFFYLNSNRPMDSDGPEDSNSEVNNNPSTNLPVETVNDQVQENLKDTQTIDLSEARKALRDEALPIGAASFTGPRPLTEEEMDKMDKLFESYEEGWDKKMREVMINDLGLSEDDYGDYLKMRDGYEEDRLEAFEEFHKKMALEKGPHYNYSPTQEMMDFDGKLRKEYLDLYRKRFGESAFVKYYNALESFNTEIRKKADPNYGVLTIEF
jgi:uncharacterized protein YnzC (UPF0291/DUF896 family)